MFYYILCISFNILCLRNFILNKGLDASSAYAECCFGVVLCFLFVRDMYHQKLVEQHDRYEKVRLLYVSTFHKYPVIV